MSNLREKLVAELDNISAITVLAEPDETGIFDKLSAVFGEFRQTLEQSEFRNLTEYAAALIRLLDQAAEGEEDDSTAFTVCAEAITAFQNIIRDGRTFEETSFPAELNGISIEETSTETQSESGENNAPANEFTDVESAGEKNVEEAEEKVMEQEIFGQETLELAERAGKYLTFHLGNEEYGLEILKVQEIIKMMEITKVPRTPGFVRGVINLRGKVIPVIDLRLKFGMETVDTTEKTCVIVVQVMRDANQITMGIIVDEVSEVIDIAAERMEPTPEFGTSVDTAFILGMGKLDNKVVMLLDVDKVLSGGELASLSAC